MTTWTWNLSNSFEEYKGEDQNNIEGIWVKYEAQPGNWSKWCSDDTSYSKLYNDLKDSGVDWRIAKSKEACMDQLCGEMIPSEGIDAGDIYVYYLNKSEKKIPVFYIHVEESRTSKERNFIFFNGCSFGYDNIDDKYMPILADKLFRIDKEKNKEYIEEIKERYSEYLMLLSLIEKIKLEEDELIFMYYMACVKKHPIAISIIKYRNLKQDFNSLSDEGKVKLYANVKRYEDCEDLVIDSKNVIKLIAQQGCLEQLANATDAIVNDKKYIMEVLESFIENDKELLLNTEQIECLPDKYKIDIEIIEQIFNNYTTIECNKIAQELYKHPENIADNPEYAYRLINSFTRALINRGETYYENYLLYTFSDDVLCDIEDHILVGPESSLEKERLKQESIKKLIKNKKTILEDRKNSD